MLNPNWVVISGILLIFSVNVGYFVVKFSQVFTGIEKRSYSNIHQFIQQNIPQGSKVVSDPRLYYAIAKASSDMQFMNLYDTLPSREQMHRQIYQYDYFIVTDNLLSRNWADVNYYLSKASFDTIARYAAPSNALNKKINALRLVSDTEENGYNCIILKRK